MPKFPTAFFPSEPDPTLSHQLAWVKRAALAAVVWISAVTLAGWLIPALGRILPNGRQFMTADSAIAMLFSAISLTLSEPQRSRRMHRLSLLLAFVVVLFSFFILMEHPFQVSLGVNALPFFKRAFPSLMLGGKSPQTAVGFALLGMSTIFIRERGRLACSVADLLACCLCLLVLVLLSAYIFDAMRLFGPSTSIWSSTQTLLCLLLLTLVTVVRRTERGIFAIYLGRGIGSRIVRVLSPILLALPFLREVGRAHLIQGLRITEHSATAILASWSSALSFTLLLLLARRINSMEMEIRNLSLRDELTGLYNLRGFSLLAEQLLRLAQRSQLPFSVMFIDLDNLKEINDSFGHSIGSAFLAETAEILKATLRGTDVMGRIGGDEFAVAGQFSHMEISLAAQRLEEAIASRNFEDEHSFPLGLSIGCVTTKEYAQQSLKDLLTEADKAMYAQKRSKKLERD